MKNIISGIFIALYAVVCAAQTTACLPLSGGMRAGDNPPGCILCGSVYQGSTDGYTPETFNLDFPCGTIDNSQWLSITADSSGLIRVSTSASNCLNNKGVQYILYDQSLNRVSNCCCCSLPGDTCSVNAPNLTPGEIYWLMIDGVEGDECDILVTVQGNALGTPPDPPGLIIAMLDTIPLCPGAEVCYSIKPVGGASEYEWRTPGNSAIISGGGLLDTFVCVEYLSAGGGVIRVTPNNDCFTGVLALKPVIVVPILPTTITKTVCLNDNPGNTQVIYSTALGCDSVVTYIYIPLVQIPNILDTIICPNQCVQIGNDCYDEPITQTITLVEAQSNGCDSIIILTIEVTDTIPGPKIECKTTVRETLFDWNSIPNATGYIVFINGDSATTVTQTEFSIDSLMIGDSLTFGVQPIGDFCNFLSAELKCQITTGTELPIGIYDLTSVFPNPTNGLLNISSSISIQKIEIFDLTGKRVSETASTVIDLSSAPAGIYFIKINTAKGIIVKKILKK